MDRDKALEEKKKQAALKETIARLEQKKKDISKAKKELSKKQAKEEQRKRIAEEKSNQSMLIQSTQMSIPISDVLDGVVITKDKRYLKIMEFEPQNFLMFSNKERNDITDSFSAMLHNIPGKIQFKVLSRKAKTESLLKGFRRFYEKETNPPCRRMQKEYMDLIEDTALREGVSRRFFVIIEHTGNIETDGTDFKAVALSLKSAAKSIQTTMESAGNRFIPSCDTDAGITEILYEMFNRAEAETNPFSSRAKKVVELYLENNGGDAENLPPIPATEFIAPPWIDYEHSRYIVINDKFYTFGYFAANNYPRYVLSGWLSGIINACEGIDVDIFLERVEREKVENKIGRQIRLNRAKSKEMSDTNTDYSNVEGVIESGMYLLDGISGGEDFFYGNIFITVCADSLKEMEYRYKEVEKLIGNLGVSLRRCTYQMEQAFSTVMPLCKMDKNLAKKSRRNMLRSGASSLYPFVSFEMQDPNGIMMGVNKSNNSLVAVDVFDTARHPNANGAILGKSGYGKTFTANLLAIRMRLQDIQTFIITPLKGKEDYSRVADKIDGEYIYLGPGSSYSINVMDIVIPDNSSLEALGESVKDKSYLARKVQDIHTFLNLVVERFSQEEEQLLDAYIYKTYEDFGITDNNDSLYVDKENKVLKECPLLGDLYERINGVPELQRIANIMSPMVSGSMSSYNRHTNVDLTKKYIVFDMDGLKDRALVISMFIALDFVWSKIKENRLAKKAVFIDEAWQLIGNKSNEMTAEYVKEMFKTIRAFGGSAFVMTQDVSDFFSLNNGEYGKAIINNSDTKIVLHLDSTEADVISKMMRLNNEEQKKIEKLGRGSGLIAAGNSRLFVDFVASPFEKSVITTDPNDLRQTLERNLSMQILAAAKQAELEAAEDEE